MNGLLDLMNQNQGVLAAIAIGVTIMGGIIAWLFKKDKQASTHINSPYIKAGHGISAGGDIIVGGSKTHIVNENFPTIVIKPDSFTHNTGRFDLIFENTGRSTAIVQKLLIGKDDTKIDEFSLSPQQKITKHLNVSGFKILEQKLNTPNFELLYKDFSNNKQCQTIGNINQESRADGKYNLGKITGQEFIWSQEANQLDEKEIEILKAIQDSKQTAHIFKIDSLLMPAFMKVGNVLFHKDGETVLAREYVEAARALAIKGYVEDIGNETFSLTTKGMKVKVG